MRFLRFMKYFLRFPHLELASFFPHLKESDSRQNTKSSKVATLTNTRNRQSDRRSIGQFSTRSFGLDGRKGARPAAYLGLFARFAASGFNTTRVVPAR